MVSSDRFARAPIHPWNIGGPYVSTCPTLPGWAMISLTLATVSASSPGEARQMYGTVKASASAVSKRLRSRIVSFVVAVRKFGRGGGAGERQKGLLTQDEPSTSSCSSVSNRTIKLRILEVRKVVPGGWYRTPVRYLPKTTLTRTKHRGGSRVVGRLLTLTVNFLPLPSFPAPHASTETLPPQHNPPTATCSSTAGYLSPISLRTFSRFSTAFSIFPAPAWKSLNICCFSGFPADRSQRC